MIILFNSIINIKLRRLDIFTKYSSISCIYVVYYNVRSYKSYELLLNTTVVCFRFWFHLCHDDNNNNNNIMSCVVKQSVRTCIIFVLLDRNNEYIMKYSGARFNHYVVARWIINFNLSFKSIVAADSFLYTNKSATNTTGRRQLHMKKLRAITRIRRRRRKTK